MKEYFSYYITESFEAIKRRRDLIAFFAVTHVVFLLLGIFMAAKGVPGALALREEQLKMLKDAHFLKPLTGILAQSLPLQILYVFFYNLIIGAFVSTTLLGALFFLPYVVAVWRSFMIGLLIYGNSGGVLTAGVIYSTFVLEFGAYAISSAAGTDIGLTLLWPERKGRGLSRKEALIDSSKDCVRLYIAAGIMLFISAVWEMGWIRYIGKLINF